MAETTAPSMARGADRISDLPEAVIHNILSLLPAQDAVRTCVLAQSWRNHWQSAPALRFACSTDVVGVADAFRLFVDALLRARRGGPPLDSCDFDLDLNLESGDFDLDKHCYRWIFQVMRLKVRELRFRLSEKPYYQFTLFFRDLSSHHLTSLELSGVTDPDAKLNFSEMHSPSLKNLIIKNCFFDSKYRTRMSLPSLVSFEFINNFGRAPMLERMPYLETAKVRFDDGFCDDECENGRLDDCGDATCEGCFNYYGHGQSGSLFLHGLAEATYLNLSACPNMYVFNRDLKWCPAFNKLKTLVLSKWFLSTDLSALIWFLHHTPLLEKLTLEIPEEHESLMETEGSYNPLEKPIAPSHLQTVEVICKDVDGIVLKVLKVLNANGIALGKIRIQCSGYNFVCTDINK